jgi:hypothetical protein
MPDVPVTTSEAEALRARAARCRAQAKAFQSEFGPKLIVLAEELEKRAEAIEARAVPAQPPRSA